MIIIIIIKTILKNKTLFIAVSWGEMIPPAPQIAPEFGPRALLLYPASGVLA